MNTTPNETGIPAGQPPAGHAPQATLPPASAAPPGQYPFPGYVRPEASWPGPGWGGIPAGYYAPPAYAPYPQQGQPQAVPASPAYQAGAYAPAAYPPVGYAPAAPTAYPAPPPFAIGGVRAPRDPRVKGASKTLNRMCLLVAAQTVAMIFWEVLFTVLMALMGVDILTNDFAFLWLSTVLVPLSTALPFFLYLAVGKKDLGQYLKFQRVGFFGGSLCVLGGLAICLLANYPSFFIQDLLGNFGYESAAGASFYQADSWPALILELLSTAVLVPVMEEFAFRGVLLSSLRKYGIGFAVVASALVFGLVHLDVANVLFAFIAGLVFGFLYARTNNLWLTIAIHALNNGLAVLTSHTGFLFGEEMAYVADSALMLVPIAVGVLALIILFAFKRDLFITYLSPRYDGPQRPLKAGETALGIVSAPVFWVIVGMMVLYTVMLFL